MTGAAGQVPLIACAILVFAGLVLRIDGYPLLDPDEGRNAEVAREMAASNTYLLPRLNTLPYVDKPLLYFAVGAVSIRLLGPTEFAARLPSLLFTLATLLVTWWIGRRLFGPEAGVIAAIITGASPLTLGFARTVIFDSALTFFVVTALIAFYCAVEETAGRRAGGPAGSATGSPAVSPSSRSVFGWWPAIAWGAIGLGVLTKGPIALALPLMIAIPYIVWRRVWRAVIDPVGILLFLALVLPWVRYMSEHVPGYLHYVLATETFGRLTTPTLQRTGPWWYFLPILLVGALPWSVMAIASLRRSTIRPSDHPTIVFLALWILVPLVFFSLSQSKRPQYVLPLVPAIGLLVAARWNARSIIWGGSALGAFGVALVAGHWLIMSTIRGLTLETAAAIPPTALQLGLISLAAGVAAIRLRHRPYWALLVLSLPVSVVPFVSAGLMREVGRDRSAVELARAIRPVLTDNTEVIGVSVYPPSLPFYLRRTLTLSTATGRELTSNYLSADLAAWTGIPGTPLRAADWWREAALECGRPRVFVVGEADSAARAFLGRRLPHLAETRKYSAYGPCGSADLAMHLP